MFHNYIVKYPDLAVLVSVETKESPEFISSEGHSRLHYSGKHDIYLDGLLKFPEAEDFKINPAFVVLQWTSEKV